MHFYYFHIQLNLNKMQINNTKSDFSFIQYFCRIKKMKSTCKKKFLNELIKIRQKPQNQSCTEAILIADEKGTQILKEIVTVENLLDIGIKNITKISLNKKPEPNAIGIYFIGQQSIKLIQKDFDKKPIFFSINILVCEQVSQQVMKSMANCEKIMQRLSTFMQLHFSVNYFTESLAILPDDQNIFLSSVYKQTSRVAQEIGQKAYQSIVASFNSLNSVQLYYSDQSKFSISLANRVYKCFENNQKNGHEQENMQMSTLSLNNKKNQQTDDLTVIFFDRAIDWVSPMVRNFYYYPMIADLFNITDYKNLTIINLNKEIQQVKIEESDKVFRDYKNKHVSDAISQITRDFQKFTASNKAAKFQRQKQLTTSNKELKDVIKQLPQYTKTIKQYNLHIEIMREISNKSKRERFSQLGELEHLIITSLTSQAEVEKDKKIHKRALQILSTLNDVQVKARIIYLMLQCLQISQKQKQDLLAFYDKTPGFQKFSTFFEKPTTGKLRYNPLFKKQTIYLDRHECIIAKKTQQIMLDKPSKQFKKLQLDLSSQGKFSKFKKLQRKLKKKLLVVMIGGLSVNEISNIERGAQRLDTHQVFFLTDHITSPKIFLNDIKQLVKSKK